MHSANYSNRSQADVSSPSQHMLLVSTNHRLYSHSQSFREKSYLLGIKVVYTRGRVTQTENSTNSRIVIDMVRDVCPDILCALCAHSQNAVNVPNRIKEEKEEKKNEEFTASIRKTSTGRRVQFSSNKMIQRIMFYRMVYPVCAMHQYVVVVDTMCVFCAIVCEFLDFYLFLFFLSSSGFWFAFICDVEYMHYSHLVHRCDSGWNQVHAYSHTYLDVFWIDAKSDFYRIVFCI